MAKEKELSPEEEKEKQIKELTAKIADPDVSDEEKASARAKIDIFLRPPESEVMRISHERERRQAVLDKIIDERIAEEEESSGKSKNKK
jgi:hypothetical protein